MSNRQFLSVMLLSVAISSQAQFWNRLPGGNVINTNEWLGAAVGSTVPLRIETRVNQPIEWYTSAIQRMQLNPTQNGVVGGWNISQNGFLGLSGRPDFFNPMISPGPFSRLHLVDDVGLNNPNVYAQQWGFRDWQRNGITFTGNSDQAYIGQKGRTDDHTDLVLQWSDNIAGAEWGTDRLRFIFTGGYQSWSPHGAYSYEGLESFRIFIADEDDPHVGIGDWWKATVQNGGVIVDPTERLDVLDGRVRIRQLPDDSEAPELTKVLVVDDVDPQSDEYGVVKWRTIPVGGGGGNPCSSGWTMIGDNPVTAYNGNPCPPQDLHFVGIGTSVPQAKLHVNRYLTNGQTMPYGMMVDLTTTTSSNTATRSSSVGVGGTQNVGVEARGHGAQRNFGIRSISAAVGIGSHTGVYALGSGFSGNGTNYGVYSHSFGGNSNIGVYANGGAGAGTSPLQVTGVRAIAGGNSMTGNTYGIHATATGGNPATTWAGYFEGNVNVIGTGYYVNGTFVASDEAFKTNIADLESPLSLLSQIQPRQYTYAVDQFEFLDLPDGAQAGFIAQELENVLPSLVSATRIGATYDSLGTELTPAVDYKAVNYTGLIPYLVAGIQEQQTQITDQAATNAALNDQMADLLDRMDQMEQLLAACCQNPDPDQRNLIDDGTGVLDQGNGDRNLRIQPNPFNEQTTVYYKLERSGRMQLMANSSDGKQLRVLHEAQMEQGEYQYEWQTADLAPGIYYVTLLLDGEPIVKKAVKVR